MGAVGWAAARDPRQGHRWNDHRMVIDGVLFRTRTGCPGGTCRRGTGTGRRSMTGTAGGRWMAPGSGSWTACGPAAMRPRVRTGRSARTRPWCAGISTRPARRPGRHIGDGKTRRATGAPAAGGAAARPAFDPGCYKQRNTVERCFSKLKQFRAVATRYDKRERIYQGTVDIASIRIWLRDPVPCPPDMRGPAAARQL